MALRLAVQESLLPAQSLDEKWEQAAAWGYDAIELRGDTLRTERRAIVERVRRGEGRVAGIVGGYRGWPIAADEDERLQCLEDIVRLLNYAAEVEAAGVIVVPIFGYSDRLPFPQKRDAVADEARLEASLDGTGKFRRLRWRADSCSNRSTATRRTSFIASMTAPRGASGCARSRCGCSRTSFT